MLKGIEDIVYLLKEFPKVLKVLKDIEEIMYILEGFIKSLKSLRSCVYCVECVCHKCFQGELRNTRKVCKSTRKSSVAVNADDRTYIDFSLHGNQMNIPSSCMVMCGV